MCYPSVSSDHSLRTGTCQVMRRTDSDALCSDARQTALYPSLVLAQARGQPSATCLIPQRHRPQFPYFDDICACTNGGGLSIRTSSGGCMDLIMLRWFGGGN